MERALVLGDGPLARGLLDQLESRPELGFRVVCQLTEDQDWNGQALRQNLPQELRQFRIPASGAHHGRHGRPPRAVAGGRATGTQKAWYQVQDGAELYGDYREGCSGSLRPSALLFSSAFQVPAISWL